MNVYIRGLYTIRCAGRTYVGSSIDIPARLVTHRGELKRGKHSNPILQRAWSKHGEAAFSFDTLAELPGASGAELLEAERDAIARIPEGERFNIVLDPTTAGRFGQLNKGRKQNAAERAMRSKIAKGRSIPLKVREAASLALKGNQHAKGLKRSAETRAKMSEAAKARWSKMTPAERKRATSPASAACKRRGKRKFVSEHGYIS